MKSYRVYLTQAEPPSTLTPVCFSVSVPVELIPFINAHLYLLAKGWMWANANEVQQELVIDAITGLMAQFAEQCAMLEDVRITPDGLEKKDCNGNWELVGAFPHQPVLYFQDNKLHIDMNGDGIAEEISPTLNLYQTYADPRLTLPEWPQTSELDVYCYAAWRMARYYQDRSVDFAQLLDVSASVIGSGIENATSFLAGIIAPGVGEDLVSPIAEFVNDGLIQPAIDFFRQNVGEFGAQSAAAEIFYCAIKETIQNGEHPDNIQGNIEKRIPSALLFAATKAAGGNWLINGLSGALSFVMGESDDKATGAFIVAYSLVLNSIIADELELSKTYQAIYAFAAREAQFFDGRDCAEFPCSDSWEYIFDWRELTEPTPVTYEFGTFEPGVGLRTTDNSLSATTVEGVARAVVSFPYADGSTQITGVEMASNIAGGSGVLRIIWSTYAGATLDEIRDDTLASGTKTTTLNSPSATLPDSMRFAIRTKEYVASTVPEEGYIYWAKLTGTGKNPFEV